SRSACQVRNSANSSSSRKRCSGRASRTCSKLSLTVIVLLPTGALAFAVPASSIVISTDPSWRLCGFAREKKSQEPRKVPGRMKTGTGPQSVAQFRGGKGGLIALGWRQRLGGRSRERGH